MSEEESGSESERFHADMIRPDVVVLMPDRVAFQVRLVENVQATKPEQVFDAGFLRIEARGPIGTEDDYLWIADARNLAVTPRPCP